MPIAVFLVVLQHWFSHGKCRQCRYHLLLIVTTRLTTKKIVSAQLKKPPFPYSNTLNKQKQCGPALHFLVLGNTKQCLQPVLRQVPPLYCKGTDLGYRN